MIDLADPNTDVVKLYKEFKKLYRQTRFDNIFFEYGAIEYLLGNKRMVSKDEIKKAKQIIAIWLRLGYIMKKSGWTYWFMH